MNAKDKAKLLQIIENDPGTHIPLDRRSISRELQRWGEVMGLFEIRNNKRLYIRSFSPFDYIRSTPIEILWALVSPMIPEGGIGYTINKAQGWGKLNIYPSTDHHASERDMNDREQVLYRLHQAGYINFLSAGSVWRIDRCK